MDKSLGAQTIGRIGPARESQLPFTALDDMYDHSHRSIHCKSLTLYRFIGLFAPLD